MVTERTRQSRPGSTASGGTARAARQARARITAMAMRMVIAQAGCGGVERRRRSGAWGGLRSVYRLHAAAPAGSTAAARLLPRAGVDLIVDWSGPWGRSGFDGGCEANVACRGCCSPRQKGQNGLTANDNYALAA